MRKHFFLLIILIICQCPHTNSLLNERLITDYFRKKSSTLGTIFSCSVKKDQINLMKYLTNHLEVSYFTIENITASCEPLIKHHYSVVVIDAECKNAELFLTKCAELRFFYHSYNWLAFGILPNVTEKFRNVALTINTDLKVVVPHGKYEDGKQVKWTVLDVYNPSYNHEGQLHVEQIGFYSEKDGFAINSKKPMYYRRRNMSGTVFRTVMVITENISVPLDEYLSNEEERNNNSFTRWHHQMIRNCRDFFNFTMKVAVTNSWGYQLPDGSVDGMLRELEDKRIDFGLAPLLFKLYRLKRVDYGHGSWIMSLAFFLRHPKTTSSSYELFVQPLVTEVWLATFVTLSIIVILLRLTVTKEKRTMNKTINGDDSSWSFLILYGIGEICQQGYGYVPNLSSGRIVILVVVVFSFLIYQFYSASLVSLILLHPPRTINTLLDLLNSPLKTGCEDTLYDKFYFSETTDPVAIELYNRKIKGLHNKTNFLRIQEGLKYVLDGGYAFHTQATTAYPIIENTFSQAAICDLVQVQMHPTQLMYAVTQKRSPFTKIFNYCLMRQKEVGVTDRLIKYWDARKPFCLDSTNYIEIAVSLEESYWALLLFSIGIVLSLFMLIVERLWTMKKRSICRKSQINAVEPFVN